MPKPALAILAAGIGSRYGGLKQIDPVGANRELIIDYSIYDAIAAGFERIIFIITRKLDADFREIIGDRIEKRAEVSYAYQELDQLPAGYSPPEGRTKPWGTTHAVLAAKDLIDGPFAVVNADDYYGPSAFKTIYKWLIEKDERPSGAKHDYAMVGYRIENTVADTGYVTRGVCEANAGGFLTSVTERKMIVKTPSGAKFSEDDGASWTPIPAGTLVSMNFWGFDAGFVDEAERNFSGFLDKNLPVNPMKCEYLLPDEVDYQLKSGRADVRVLESDDTWYGVTYREDHPWVAAAIRGMHEEGLYPTPLWK